MTPISQTNWNGSVDKRRKSAANFRGATINSDAGLLSARELDEALGLTEMGTGNARHCGGPDELPYPTRAAGVFKDRIEKS